MTTATTSRTIVLLDYLHDARTAERALADQVSRQLGGLPDSDYRTMLTRHATKTRQRMHDLDARIAALGEPRGRLSATAVAMRQLADDALEVSSAAVAAGLHVLRRDPIEPTMVDFARELAAATAFAHTTHRALAEAAQAVNDSATAELASTCRSELRDSLAEIDDAIPALVAAALQTVDLRPSYREAATTATRRVREVASHLGEDVEHAQHELRGTVDELLRRARRAPTDTSAEGAQGEGAATAAEEAGLPIADYTRLTSAQVVRRLTQLTAEQLEAVERFEGAHAARTTVLNKIQSLRKEEPGMHGTP